MFYGGHWNKQSSKEDRDAAFNASLAVFIQNPKLFILSRLETLATVGEKNTQTTCSGIVMEERGFPRLFEYNNIVVAGEAVLNLIRETETDEGILGGRRIWWNVYVSVILLSIILAFFKIAPGSSIISLVLLARTAAVFLAAPAGFSIYYSTLFIGTPLVVLFFICEIMKRQKNSSLDQRRECLQIC